MLSRFFKRRHPEPEPSDAPEAIEVAPLEAIQVDEETVAIAPELEELTAEVTTVEAIEAAPLELEIEAEPQAAPFEPVDEDASVAPRKMGLFRRLGAVFGGRKLDEALLEDLEEQMLMSDVSLDTTQRLLNALREAAKRGEVPDNDAALQVLQAEVATLLQEGASPLQFAEDGLTVWLFVGVNGVGKTTSVGKLAHRLVREGHKPLLVAGDTFRAAAVEQLQEWGRRAGVPVIAQGAGADPAAVVHDAIGAAKSRGCDIVLVDTAGRLHTKGNLMSELSKIGRIIEREAGHTADETLLVLDATTGQNGLVQAQAFTGSTPLSGLILSKWDGTAKGGIILSVAQEAGVPVKLVGVGEKAEDLKDFDPREFAREMFA